ncbi:IQ domain-containing protein M [Anolis sagrei]|uniref:IQ domain-containing protein M n=1 Tax=Anolis sagrei TaxID=38937 RepID=UPI0035219B56
MAIMSSFRLLFSKLDIPSSLSCDPLKQFPSNTQNDFSTKPLHESAGNPYVQEDFESVMDHIVKMPGEPARQTSLSAPPILTTHEAIKHSENTQTTTSFNKIAFKEILDKRPLRPYSDTCQSTRSIKCSAKKQSDVSQPIQCGKEREKMWLSDVFTRVGPLSKAMEQQRNKQEQSIGSSNLLGLSTSNQGKNAWLLKNHKGKMYQDWRGIIVSETTTPYTMLSNKEHQERLNSITRRKRAKMPHPPSSRLERHQQELKLHGKKPYSKRDAFNFVTEKVRRIGPHLEIFEAFTHHRKPLTKEIRDSAAVCLQKSIRGWLERTQFRRLRAKAKNHGPSFSSVVKDYRKMMARIKRRCGILDISTPLEFAQLEDWLDKKLLFETMYTKRVLLKELDQNELPKFFRDCGRFPSQNEINSVLKLVSEGSDTKIASINKNQVVEMAFMLYPPRGMKLPTAAVQRSTWRNPIIDGEDGSRYLKRGHPAIKKTDFRVAAALVAASMRERKRKEQEMKASLSAN